MKNKLLIILIALLLTSSCAGFGKKRSEKSDEFLIEKKAPLVMPPDIDDLPQPKEGKQVQENDNDFKEILSSKNNENQDTNIDTNSSLTENIMKKIEE